MFNPLNDPQAEQWFQRFAAVTRNLPFNEYAVQRQEIQQHLEALAAAREELGSPPAEAWRLALKRFGNPTKIGRKMYQEWRQGYTGPGADILAVSYAMIFASSLFLAFMMCDTLRRLIYHDMFVHHPFPIADVLTCGFAGMLLFGVAIGRNFPLRAIKAAFYSSQYFACYWECSLPVPITPEGIFLLSVRFFLLILACALGFCGVAYLASVTKRGWYRPSWADFKLTLPRRRPQTSR